MSLLATHLHNDGQAQDSFDTLDDEERNFDSYYQDDLEEEDGDDGVSGIPGHNLCIVGFLYHVSTKHH